VSKQNEQRQTKASAQAKTSAPAPTKAPASAPTKAPASAQAKASAPNKFALLQELMDEEEETTARVAREKQEAEEKAREFQKTFPAMAPTTRAAAVPAGATWAKIAGKPAQKPADLPYNDECPEMQKHFRKTIAVMFKEKEPEKVEQENAVGEAYSCGFSWADE